MMKFKDRKVVITGGSGGIGHQLCQRFIEEGAVVYALDKMDCKNPLTGVRYFNTDLTSAEQVEKAYQKIGGGIDILINNAGVMKRGDLFESSDQDYDFLMGVNLKGSWLMLKFGKPYLKPNSIILQMSSRHGSTMKVDPALYSLSKYAVAGLAELLQVTVPDYKVKIAYPGPVDTPLTWTDVKEEDKTDKQKIIVTTEFIVDKLIELIISDHAKLLYDQEKLTYYFAD